MATNKNYVIPPPDPIHIPVIGGGAFPVRRIFCAGRNYADHVKEMGGDPAQSLPVFFTKPASAVVIDGLVQFPHMTDELHFEGELVVAVGKGAHDFVSPAVAAELIFGFAAGCDLTRRDLQTAAKKNGGPWATAKGFDGSAPIGTIAPAAELSLPTFYDGSLVTKVNNAVRQNAPLSSMILNVPALISELSRYFKLGAGDIIFTGTPEGVGELHRSDNVEVLISDLPCLKFKVLPET